MLRFCFFLLAWFAADLLFWWAGDRQFRRLRHPRVWRGIFAAFMLMQTVYLVYSFIRIFVDDPPDLFPLTWHVAAYLWHLLLLPVAIVGVISVAIIKVAVSLIARKRSPNPAPA